MDSRRRLHERFDGNSDVSGIALEPKKKDTVKTSTVSADGALP